MLPPGLLLAGLEAGFGISHIRSLLGPDLCVLLLLLTCSVWFPRVGYQTVTPHSACLMAVDGHPVDMDEKTTWNLTGAVWKYGECQLRLCGETEPIACYDLSTCLRTHVLEA